MAYLLFVLVASSVGIAIVVWRHRQRTSLDSSVREFGRNLQALAPSDESPRGARPPRRR
jgi:hypothetical protein